MTTIAYAAGYMAADGKCTDDAGYFATKCQKIFRLSNGALLGTAGDADTRLIQDVLGKVRGEKSLPSRKELADTKTGFSGLFVLKSGAAYFVDIDHVDYGSEGEWTGQIVEIKERIAAIGSGEQFALGAMAAGKSAEEAVHIACRYDTRSGPPVHAVALKLRTKPAVRKKAGSV